jgi:hypothetical protein
MSLTSRLLPVVTLCVGVTAGVVMTRKSASSLPAAPSIQGSTNLTEGSPKSGTKPAPPATFAMMAAEIEARMRKAMAAPGNRRWRLMQELVLQLRPEEFAAALAAAERLPRNERYNFRSQILERWAEVDPQAVLAQADTTKNRWERQNARSSALREWGRTDVDAAMQWARDHSTGSEQRQLIAAAIGGDVTSPN